MRWQWRRRRWLVQPSHPHHGWIMDEWADEPVRLWRRLYARTHWDHHYDDDDFIITFICWINVCTVHSAIHIYIVGYCCWCTLYVFLRKSEMKGNGACSSSCAAIGGRDQSTAHGHFMAATTAIADAIKQHYSLCLLCIHVAHPMSMSTSMSTSMSSLSSTIYIPSST